MPACTRQPVATCMHPHHCTHMFETAHTCLQLPPLPRASRGVSLSLQPRQLSNYLVEHVMTSCNGENQVDVVFSKFLPKKCQGRIILGGKSQAERLVSNTETKTNFIALLFPIAKFIPDTWRVLLWDEVPDVPAQS